jgi:DNA mismatch endonuclease, patch repair protein
MQRQARRDTRPEMALRRELFSRGLRYRIGQRPLPDFRRHVDVVFRKLRVAVEVRGCFWHFCPEHGLIPRTNSEWWRQKLARTRMRDEETAKRLREAGWTLILVWEHEDMAQAALGIHAIIQSRRGSGDRATPRADRPD